MLARVSWRLAGDPIFSWVCDPSSVEVRFVGSGDAFGSGGRFQTCIRLRGAGQTVLVDCGATSLTALKSQGLDPGEVDAVVVTHLHGDHFGGLPFLVLDGQFSRRTRPLRVLGPAGTAERLASAMEAFYPGSTAVRRRFTLDVTELDGCGTAVALGDAVVAGWEVDHASGAPALAVQVALNGSRFGYSGDTAWTPALRDAARDTDVFACEAYTWQRTVPYHLAYATLVEHQAEFDTGRLVVTHMGPEVLGHLDQVTQTAASDGLVLHA